MPVQAEVKSLTAISKIPFQITQQPGFKVILKGVIAVFLLYCSTMILCTVSRSFRTTLRLESVLLGKKKRIRKKIQTTLLIPVCLLCAVLNKLESKLGKFNLHQKKKKKEYCIEEKIYADTVPLQQLFVAYPIYMYGVYIHIFISINVFPLGGFPFKDFCLFTCEL